jgi:hypothetical protein
MELLFPSSMVSLSGHLFGFKKFSCLIYSLPDILTVVSPPDGKNEPYAVLTRKQSAKLVDDPVQQPCPEESAEPVKWDEPEQVLLYRSTISCFPIILYKQICACLLSVLCYLYFVWIMYTYKTICKPFWLICLKVFLFSCPLMPLLLVSKSFLLNCKSFLLNCKRPVSESKLQLNSFIP